MHQAYQPLQEVRLLLTNKFSGIPGTNFNNFGEMKS